MPATKTANYVNGWDLVEGVSSLNFTLADGRGCFITSSPSNIIKFDFGMFHYPFVDDDGESRIPLHRRKCDRFWDYGRNFLSSSHPAQPNFPNLLRIEWIWKFNVICSSFNLISFSVVAHSIEYKISFTRDSIKLRSVNEFLELVATGWSLEKPSNACLSKASVAVFEQAVLRFLSWILGILTHWMELLKGF